MNTKTNTEVAAVFNLADFEARDTAWLTIQNKQGNAPLLVNGQPVRIEVRSPGTREALQVYHDLEQVVTARTVAAINGKPADVTADEKVTEKAARLAAVTAQIENFPVDPKDMYANPKLGYITAQVDRFQGDWANF